MSFADLGLSPETLKAVAEVGYTTPTPIQEQAIPWVLMGRDVMGIAQTGTGKTASFTLPMIDILANGRAKARMPRSLIIAPTRELANQAAENFTLYGKYHKLSMALLIGGESFTEQEKALDRGVDVLIATPGRLLDLFDRGRILLRDVKVLVIDEADRMLDMGFIPDVERIVSLLPPLRQTLFFSATMDDQISRLADAFLTNPKEVRVARQATTAETVTQLLAIVDELDKRETLRHILRMEDVRNAFIFCNRKRDVDILYRSLRKHGFDVAQLHGDMPQSERTATLANFKAGNVKLLVCSDVAARGIDIADVSHVFNFDVPHHAEDYVHRIGRTGRAGREGRAFTIASADDGKAVVAIEKLIEKAIPRLTLEGLEQVGFDESGEGGRRRRGKDRPDRNRADKGRADKDTGQKDTAPKDAGKDSGPRSGSPKDGRDGSRISAKDSTVTRDGKDRDRGERNDRGDRERGDRDRTDRDRTDRGDRPDRADRDRNDRDRSERDRGDRDRGDRRNDRRRRDSHPALDVPEMTFGDDVLAFGGQTPAFMLAPLTLTEELALRPRSAHQPQPVDDETDDDLPESRTDEAAADSDAAPSRSKRNRRRRGRGGDDGQTVAAETVAADAVTGNSAVSDSGVAEAVSDEDGDEDHAEEGGKDNKPRRPAKTSARIAKKLSKKQSPSSEADAQVSEGGPAEAESAEEAAVLQAEAEQAPSVVAAPEEAAADAVAEEKPAKKPTKPRPSRAKAAKADAPADAAAEDKPAKKPAKPRPSRAKAAKAEAPADAVADGAVTDGDAPKKPARKRAPRKTAAPETPDAGSEGSSEG